jgi:hypothetical protein
VETWLQQEEEESEQEGGTQGSERSGSVVFCLDNVMSDSGAANANDVLAREWSRVRMQPQTSGCLGVDGRKGCAGF